MPTEPTPAKVLTKSQLKRAARENKVRTRNVLFNPFRLEWPPVSREAAAAVLTAVDSQFELFDIQTGLPQQEYVALLAAGDRAGIGRRRQEVRAAAEPLLAARRRHLAHCVLGFNAASRALESGRLAALLVEADTPALETRLLLPLAAGRRCPAVCLSRLRPALQRRLGLTTAVLGLLEEAAGADHHLRPLYEAVCAAASPLVPRRAAPSADSEQPTSAAEVADQPSSVPPDQPAPDLAESLNESETPNEDLAAAEPSPPPSPVPFEQSDFISLSVSAPARRRAAPAEEGPLLDLMAIDRRGVPHKERLRLKEPAVMQVTLGNKALKRAARAASKRNGAPTKQ